MIIHFLGTNCKKCFIRKFAKKMFFDRFNNFFHKNNGFGCFYRFFDPKDIIMKRKLRSANKAKQLK